MRMKFFDQMFALRLCPERRNIVFFYEDFLVTLLLDEVAL